MNKLWGILFCIIFAFLGCKELFPKNTVTEKIVEPVAPVAPVDSRVIPVTMESEAKIESQAAKMLDSGSIESNLDIYYNPEDATLINYIVYIKNNTANEAVVDLAIVENGKTLKEHTLGTKSFKQSSCTGQMAFDVSTTHIFSIKINRITYLGK